MSSAEFTEQWAYDVLEQEDQAAARAAETATPQGGSSG
jgi:hypothetical protein